tara:strand:- start:96 stop:347 length:252 start_codon:yes stop_codon:yes gene_type:complete
MPRTRKPANPGLIESVISSDRALKEAHTAYKKAQDDHLRSLREARAGGETLENIADALECSKQWVHKFTTHGHDHNKVSRAEV